MARIRTAIKVLAPLAAVAGGVAMVRSVLRQRRHPDPFPAQRARMLDNRLAHRQALKAVGMLDLTPGMRVLDLGAGIGRFSIPIAQRVGPDGEVVALDIQQEMLDILEKRAADAGVANIRTLRAAAGEGAVEEAAFDRAVLVAVLGEIPHETRVAALREIADGLKPDGILYVSEVPGDPHFQIPRAVARLGAEAGLRVLRVRRLGLGHISELIKQ